MSATAPLTGITEESIALLIDRFYTAVRRDPVLGPIFENAIAEDAWRRAGVSGYRNPRGGPGQTRGGR